MHRHIRFSAHREDQLRGKESEKDGTVSDERSIESRTYDYLWAGRLRGVGIGKGNKKTEVAVKRKRGKVRVFGLHLPVEWASRARRFFSSSPPASCNWVENQSAVATPGKGEGGDGGGQTTSGVPPSSFGQVWHFLWRGMSDGRREHGKSGQEERMLEEESTLSGNGTDLNSAQKKIQRRDISGEPVEDGKGRQKNGKGPGAWEANVFLQEVVQKHLWLDSFPRAAQVEVQRSFGPAVRPVVEGCLFSEAGIDFEAGSLPLGLLDEGLKCLPPPPLSFAVPPAHVFSLTGPVFDLRDPEEARAFVRNFQRRQAIGVLALFLRLVFEAASVLEVVTEAELIALALRQRGARRQVRPQSLEAGAWAPTWVFSLCDEMSAKLGMAQGDIKKPLMATFALPRKGSAEEGGVGLRLGGQGGAMDRSGWAQGGGGSSQSLGESGQSFGSSVGWGRRGGPGGCGRFPRRTRSTPGGVSMRPAIVKYDAGDGECLDFQSGTAPLPRLRPEAECWVDFGLAASALRRVVEGLQEASGGAGGPMQTGEQLGFDAQEGVLSSADWKALRGDGGGGSSLSSSGSAPVSAGNRKGHSKAEDADRGDATASFGASSGSARGNSGEVQSVRGTATWGTTDGSWEGNGKERRVSAEEIPDAPEGAGTGSHPQENPKPNLLSGNLWQTEGSLSGGPAVYRELVNAVARAVGVDAGGGGQKGDGKPQGHAVGGVHKRTRVVEQMRVHGWTFGTLTGPLQFSSVETESGRGMGGHGGVERGALVGEGEGDIGEGIRRALHALCERLVVQRTPSERPRQSAPPLDASSPPHQDDQHEGFREGSEGSRTTASNCNTSTSPRSSSRGGTRRSTAVVKERKFSGVPEGCSEGEALFAGEPEEGGEKHMRATGGDSEDSELRWTEQQESDFPLEEILADRIDMLRSPALLGSLLEVIR
eukprot:Cvel_28114.t1-p1 / transcript=Cvel_28114.t1 / gene=Cvel_28114 / organism=Chromera_velia_CCMP2878 / gene_product=hypothetical protein / transcript_product=hypothetical protein / location=Cvel_scaffold3621:3513-14811(+) / protein_length=933 / sequence_SO=supercontig / SO=protein_coding / is_pseudo=false